MKKVLYICLTIAGLMLSSPLNDELAEFVEAFSEPVIAEEHINKPVIEEMVTMELFKPAETERVPEFEPKVVEYITLAESTDFVVEELDSNYYLTDEEIKLIALVTMAEAEGECERGQRLVIDTILNRVDSELRYFPDTVYDVVYQKNAFSSMWGSRVERVRNKNMDHIIELVKEELINRTDSEVLYFRTKYYSKYGTPLFDGPVGNHYFSGE